MCIWIGRICGRRWSRGRYRGHRASHGCDTLQVASRAASAKDRCIEAVGRTGEDVVGESKQCLFEVPSIAEIKLKLHEERIAADRLVSPADKPWSLALPAFGQSRRIIEQVWKMETGLRGGSCQLVMIDKRRSKIMTDWLKEWWDALVFGILMLVHVGGWAELKISGKLDLESERSIEKRRFAAESLSASGSSGITAVSILLPASLIILQLFTNSTNPVTDIALESMFRATIWFLISLSIGLLLMFFIPMRSQVYNVARDFRTGILFGPQLIALLVGVVWLVVSLHQALESR